MHETLHKDPTNVSKRKPRSLRGTPANKYSHLFSFGTVLIFSVLCHLYSEAEWSKPHRERLVSFATPTEEEKLHRLMMEDLFFNSAIRNLKKKQAGEEFKREELK